MDHRNSKQALKILSLQRENGSWGNFHSLSAGEICTTEGAVRRLMILGYTIKDECLHRAAKYMESCLESCEIPDGREKTHNWDIFVEMMLSSWLCRLHADVPHAQETADKWAKVLNVAFCTGTYCHTEYLSAWEAVFGEKPRGGRILDFVQPYILTLISGRLAEKAESALFDYVLHHEPGIYYVYEKAPYQLPESFQSREANRYLGAVELLSEFFPRQRNKLRFVRDWLYTNQNERGGWDMSSIVKDNVYFPLSDDWRRKGAREADITERVQKLLHQIEK